jgi:hypothetical protein
MSMIIGVFLAPAMTWGSIERLLRIGRGLADLDNPIALSRQRKGPVCMDPLVSSVSAAGMKFHGPVVGRYFVEPRFSGWYFIRSKPSSPHSVRHPAFQEPTP